MPRTLPIVVAVGLAAGCASVPTSGSVHVGRTLPGVAGLDTSDIRPYPARPLIGQTPPGIVTQYLDALVDSDNNYDIARSFLAPGTSWSPTAGITLYDQRSVTITRVAKDQVDASMRRVGVVNEHGAYRQSPSRLTARFRLVRRSGQWRIARLPSGVFLSTSDAQRALRPAELFYLNHDQTRVVPAPIVVQPDQPGLATTLVKALLSGPGRGTEPAVLTAAPRGVALVGNVPVDTDGVADVNLSGGVAKLSQPALQRLSAQIVWTLRQVPGLEWVRLSENGTPLVAAGVPPIQPVSSWQQYDPDVPPLVRGALGARDGVVEGVGRGVPAAVAGLDVEAPRVSADGATVAAIRPTAAGATLVVGPAVGRVRTRVVAAHLSSPAFDPAGDVFVVDDSAARPAVIEVPAHGRVRPVRLAGSIAARGISDLAISRDGSRVAMVVGPAGHTALAVGSLVSSANRTAIRAAAVVVRGSRDVAGVGWLRASRVVTTERVSRGQRGVLVAAIDGYRPRRLTRAGLPARPAVVAASPAQPILAATDRGIWSLTEGRWHRVSTATDPSYAG